MNVIYSENYNFDIGLLSYFHPFYGMKFKSIFNDLKNNSKIRFHMPDSAIDEQIIDDYLSGIMKYRVKNKKGILRALEFPRLPFLSYAYLDKHVLTPMRFGIAGTLLGAQKAIQENTIFWNLAGGYHHASHQNMEGFCIYNDITICYQELRRRNILSADDRILIIDTDAHHGNGNAVDFMDNRQVTILDIYNQDIYPQSQYTRERVDIPVPLPEKTTGIHYLNQYRDALNKINGSYKIAFVITGTDPLEADKLGGLSLTIGDIAQRDKTTWQFLSEKQIPAVFLGGGGYSKLSATCVTRAINGIITDAAD